MKVKRKIAIRVGAAAAGVGAAGVLLASGIATPASANAGAGPGQLRVCNNETLASFLPVSEDVIDVWEGTKYWGRVPWGSCVTMNGKTEGTTGPHMITVFFFIENKGWYLGQSTFDLNKGVSLSIQGLP
jgi:hypothetical protein